MNKTSLGDICTSKYYIGIERKPLRWWRWGFDTKPTYVGTTRGLYVATPLFVVLGHKR